MTKSLDRNSSQIIVSELVRALGEQRVLALLHVTQSRFNALATGRGCLNDAQLQQITDDTGRSWMRWGVDAVARTPRTAPEKDLDRATYELLDKIDPLSTRPSKANGVAPLPLGRAPKHRQRQAI